jgi:AraC-like DNA-binding protein
MATIIRKLFLSQLYHCGFCPDKDTKDCSDPPMLDLTMDKAVGNGFSRVFPVSEYTAIAIMDATYLRDMEIIWPQPQYLHVNLAMDKSNRFYGYYAQGETYKAKCTAGQRVCSVGVSLMPEFYENHLKKRYGISPQALVKAVSELDGFVMVPDALALLKQLAAVRLDGKTSRLFGEAKILELVSCILRWHSQKEQFAPHGIHEDDQASIRKVLSYIQKHYSAPITIDTLSRIACMSKSKLSYLFKQVTGSTMLEYIRDVRLNAAKAFLTKNEYDICQIARSVGFKCPASFTAMFRNSQGLTPSAYRVLTKHEVLPR